MKPGEAVIHEYHGPCVLVAVDGDNAVVQLPSGVLQHVTASFLKPAPASGK